MRRGIIFFLSLCTFISLVYAVDVPHQINYQGYVTSGGSAYSEPGYFKFSLIDDKNSPTTNYWTNDGSSPSAGGEPTNSISTTVSSGVFNIILGDTSITNMTEIGTSVFTDYSTVYLRVWFSTSASGTFERLSPDRKITSSAFAYNSYEAYTVESATQGAVKLGPYGSSSGNTSEIRFLELSANGSNYIGLKAPNSILSNLIWTLPNADGSSGQALSTNGSGTLSWTSVGTGDFKADGSVPMTGNLNMGSKNIANAGTVNMDTLSLGGTTITATGTELNYVDGVTSAIQTQINSKQDTITGAATTIVSSDLTASRALESNASGKVSVSSTVDSTELGYLNGVTSAIQTQIDAKASTSSPTFTGAVKIQEQGGLANLGLYELSSAPSSTANYGKVWATNSSGLDNSAVFLAHFDGTDGNTTSNDCSYHKHRMLFNGNAQIDTAQSKFGGSSLLLDGTGDYVSVLDSEDWSLGNGEFTIDFWVRFNALPSAGNFMAFFDQFYDIRAWDVSYTQDSGLAFYYSIDGVNVLGTLKTWSPSTNTWYHIAIVRTVNTMKYFVDGAQLGTDIGLTGVTIYNSSNALWIGCSHTGVGGNTPDYFLNGWFDEIRISKGIARWTTTFTPPTAAHDSAARYMDSSGNQFDVILNPR